ncbi:MAG: ABC transporter substrate-binding protein [Clostridiaceae bacterium]|nr:ABC transporter substrate-binding protein [Clostridiaceae bacterium]
MKRMKKSTIIIAFILAMVMLVACGNSGKKDSDAKGKDADIVEEKTDTEKVSADEKAVDEKDTETKKDVSIGIIQLAPHEALDKGYEGFIDGLAECGYVEGENLSLDYNNAQGDPSNATTIAQKLVNASPDLIFAVATQAAQAAANQTSDIPIVITAVTDPAQSGLVKSNDMPETNVTGTSDLTPVKEQMELIKELMPEATRVGVIFNSSEDNSLIQAKMAEDALNDLGLEYVELTVSKTDEISPVTQSAVGKIDVMYTPTDNLISNNMTAVTNITNPAGIPVVCGEVAMLEGGGLLTLGVDYYELGRQAGEMAADILDGKSVPSEMAVQYQKEYSFAVNPELAEELGVTIPADMLEKNSWKQAE